MITCVLIRGGRGRFDYRRRESDVTKQRLEWCGQGIPAATNSWERQRMDFPLKILEGITLAFFWNLAP